MTPLFSALLTMVAIVISFLQFSILVYVVLSWLVNFNIVNYRQPLVQTVMGMLDKMLEPLLRRMRKILPDLGTVDLAPLVLFVVLIGLDILIHGYAVQFGIPVYH